MKLVKNGKTKDVYYLEDGNYLLRFKDTVTGHEGGESDPGGNSVVGEVAGVGSNALRVTAYYFEMLNSRKIPTHYVGANLDKNEMTVKSATPFGQGLEFVLRYIATGSFYKRFALYCNDGQALNPPVFEVTLKDDGRGDPPATIEILSGLGLLNQQQYDYIKEQTIKICDIVRDDLAAKNIQLFDIKLEFGLVEGNITLIDEISAGNMRAYKNNKKLDYDTLSKLILA